MFSRRSFTLVRLERETYQMNFQIIQQYRKVKNKDQINSENKLVYYHVTALIQMLQYILLPCFKLFV